MKLFSRKPSLSSNGKQKICNVVEQNGRAYRLFQRVIEGASVETLACVSYYLLGRILLNAYDCLQLETPSKCFIFPSVNQAYRALHEVPFVPRSRVSDLSSGICL